MMARRTTAQKQADCEHARSWSRFVEPNSAGKYEAVCYLCSYKIQADNPVLLRRAVGAYLSR